MSGVDPLLKLFLANQHLLTIHLIPTGPQVVRLGAEFREASVGHP